MYAFIVAEQTAHSFHVHYVHQQVHMYTHRRTHARMNTLGCRCHLQKKILVLLLLQYAG